MKNELAALLRNNHAWAARVEQETYDSVVHPWERERYLERG